MQMCAPWRALGAIVGIVCHCAALADPPRAADRAQMEFEEHLSAAHAETDRLVASLVVPGGCGHALVEGIRLPFSHGYEGWGIDRLELFGISDTSVHSPIAWVAAETLMAGGWQYCSKRGSLRLYKLEGGAAHFVSSTDDSVLIRAARAQALAREQESLGYCLSCAIESVERVWLPGKPSEVVFDAHYRTIAGG